MGFFKLYLDDYGDGIQYIVRKVQRASLTLSHDEIQREGIDIEDLLYCPLRYTGAIKEMTLECDAIGEDGLDMVAKFMLKHANHLVSLSLDDVSLCAIILDCLLVGLSNKVFAVIISTSFREILKTTWKLSSSRSILHASNIFHSISPQLCANSSSQQSYVIPHRHRFA